MNKEIFKGSPSQLVNVGYFFVCLLVALMGFSHWFFIIVSIFMVGWRILKTKLHSFYIDQERVVEKQGVLSSVTNTTELYRGKDVQLLEPLLLRMFNLSTIVIKTSDKTSPIITIKGVKNGEELQKSIRDQIEKRRDVKGVVERDFS